MRFADDIDALAGEEEELKNLVDHLNNAATAFGMEISGDKTKIMTNSTDGINVPIKLGETRLETVSKFKYLGSISLVLSHLSGVCLVFAVVCRCVYVLGIKHV